MKRLFTSLRQQLVHEIYFVSNVSLPYLKPEKDLEIVDFEYKNKECQLILNGEIKLKTEKTETKVESFNDLIQGLLQSKKAVA